MKKEIADKILAETRAGYDRIADEFSSTREKLYWEELKRFVDYVREGETVLDVGCGNGRTYEIFKPKGIHYAGIDVSEKLVAKARELNPDAVFETGDVLDLPVEDGRYDVALAVAVLHHIPSVAYRLQALRELRRAVRPGGYILATSWNLWQPRYWKVLLHQLFGWKNGWDFGDFKISWKKPHFARYYHAFRLKELRRLAETAGLQVVEIYYVKKGAFTGWFGGENLVLIARRPAPPSHVIEKKNAGGEAVGGN
jgi:tRNA (uracil-5-)-methyltransferase TRM9